MTDRRYHHGDLKHALVEAGLAILEEAGLAGLSLRAIAARAGVSHAAPKNHFASLAALRNAIAAEGFRRHAAEMRRGLSPEALRVERLQAAMEGYVRFAAAAPELFALMFAPHLVSFDDPELGAAASESYAVLSGVAEGLDWDKADHADAQRRAEMMLWSFVHGYAQLKQAGLFNDPAADCTAHPLAEIMPAFAYREP